MGRTHRIFLYMQWIIPTGLAGRYYSVGKKQTRPTTLRETQHSGFTISRTQDFFDLY